MSDLVVFRSQRSWLLERPTQTAAVGGGAFIVLFFGCCFVLVLWAFVLLLVRLVRLCRFFFARGVSTVLSLCAAPFWVTFALLWWPSSNSSESFVPGLVGWEITDRCQQPVGEEEDVAEVRRVPVTAQLCARPRRRAVWVRRLEVVLGPVPSGTVGQLVRGRWTPDLPSPSFSAGLNLVLTHRIEGVKVRGGGSVAGRNKDEDVRVPYFVVESPDGSMDTLCPDLLSALSTYSFLRERDATLVSALRLRAQEFCKKHSLSSSVTWQLVPSAVRWAWDVSARERLVREGIQVDSTGECWWS